MKKNISGDFSWLTYKNANNYTIPCLNTTIYLTMLKFLLCTYCLMYLAIYLITFYCLSFPN